MTQNYCIPSQDCDCNASSFWTTFCTTFDIFTINKLWLYYKLWLSVMFFFIIHIFKIPFTIFCKMLQNGVTPVLKAKVCTFTMHKYVTLNHIFSIIWYNMYKYNSAVLACGLYLFCFLWLFIFTVREKSSNHFRTGPVGCLRSAVVSSLSDCILLIVEAI